MGLSFFSNIEFWKLRFILYFFSFFPFLSLFLSLSFLSLFSLFSPLCNSLFWYVKNEVTAHRNIISASMKIISFRYPKVIRPYRRHKARCVARSRALSPRSRTTGTEPRRRAGWQRGGKVGSVDLMNGIGIAVNFLPISSEQSVLRRAAVHVAFPVSVRPSCMRSAFSARSGVFVCSLWLAPLSYLSSGVYGPLGYICRVPKCDAHVD